MTGVSSFNILTSAWAFTGRMPLESSLRKKRTWSIIADLCLLNLMNKLQWPIRIHYCVQGKGILHQNRSELVGVVYDSKESIVHTALTIEIYLIIINTQHAKYISNLVLMFQMVAGIEIVTLISFFDLLSYKFPAKTSFYLCRRISLVRISGPFKNLTEMCADFEST